MKTQPIPHVSTWGATTAERTLSFPCDRYLSLYDAAYFRAVSVQAPASIVFRWLCQLRVAPYSYDWIDNGGRRSPRHLIPGLEQLSVGQSMCQVFQLADFEPDQHMTLILKAARARDVYGEGAISYLIVPQAGGGCRLIAKFLVRYPHGPKGAMMRWWLPWGDLIMMRKQLLTFKQLAEQQS